MRVSLKCAPHQLRQGNLEGVDVEMHFEGLDAYSRGSPSSFTGVRRLSVRLSSLDEAAAACDFISRCVGVKTAVVRMRDVKKEVPFILHSSCLTRLRIVGDMTFGGMCLPALHTLEVVCEGKLLQLHPSDAFPSLQSLWVTARYLHRDVAVPPSLHRLRIHAQTHHSLSLSSVLPKLTYLCLGNLTLAVDFETCFANLLHLQLEDATLNDLPPSQLVALAQTHPRLEALTVVCVRTPASVLAAWSEVRQTMGGRGSCIKDGIVLQLQLRAE